MKIPEVMTEVLERKYTYKEILTLINPSMVLYMQHISGSNNISRQ